MDFGTIGKHVAAVFLLATVCCGMCKAQYERTCVKRDFNAYYKNANYDETKVPEYSLPNVMLCLSGERVNSAERWEAVRRPELMSLFTEFMYGRQPAPDSTFRMETAGADRKLKNLRALRRDIIMHLTADGPDVTLSIIWRNKGKRAVPQKTILGLSFIPTDSILTVHKDGSLPKGAEAWQVDSLLSHGFALAIFCYTDAEKDKAKDDFQSSLLHRHFYKPAQQYPMPDEWGALACWAWTASRAVDAMQRLAADVVKLDDIAVMGHSRLGKTALWAGATDQRFRAVVAVNSGCCGAALSRRCFGETLECVNEFSYQWLCGNFRQFSHRENYLPFDQHELLALIAPRKLIVISGTEDLWADPKGEELGCTYARLVFSLYGKSDALVYRLRQGPHAVLKNDWSFILKTLE